MISIKLLLITLLVVISTSLSAKVESDDPVTCGSAIKLIHVGTKKHLHSHAITWGSGSGQQSITANEVQNDAGSLWLIKHAVNSPPCEVGTPILCNSKVRLEHASTSKNLHSHLFKAALTGNQEVSGFGDNGNGDTGDNWHIVCETSNKNDKFWRRGQSIHLQHADTGKYLFTTEQAKFNQQNCGGGCPIMGQTEVSASGRRDTKTTAWQTGQGVYFPPVIAEEDSEL